MKRPAVKQLENIHARIRDAGELAIGHYPEAKLQAKASEFLKYIKNADSEYEIAVRMVDAMGYAIDLALFTPSMSGQTAVDRLIRSGALKDAADMEAAKLLRASVFRLIVIRESSENGFVEVEDIASGAHLALFHPSRPLGKGERWVLHACPHDGVHISAGPLTPLDDGMLEAARPYIEKGRGIKNPVRCAEVLYRQFMRNGDPFANALPKEEQFPFGAGDGRLHGLAAEWAAKESLPEPDAEEMREIRAGAHAAPVFDALEACYIAHDMKLKPLAAAYERIIVIQLETVNRRTASGIRTSNETLDGMEAELRADVMLGRAPSAVGELFADLCRRARLSGSGRCAGKANMAELDKVLARIQALRSKTVEHGCTEEEALLAAEKMAELLDRYGLSLSEVELKEQSCGGEGIETTRRRFGPLDSCVSAIARFCDCRSWYEMTATGHIKHILFGMPADVAGACCLYEKIEQVFETETQRFKGSELYDSHHSRERRTATSSFQAGLQHGLCGKLKRLKEERSGKAKAGGRDLVPLKNDMIEDELAALGMNFHTTKAGSNRRLLADAYHTGVATGESVEWEEQIEAA